MLLVSTEIQGREEVAESQGLIEIDWETGRGETGKETRRQKWKRDAGRGRGGRIGNHIKDWGSGDTSSERWVAIGARAEVGARQPHRESGWGGPRPLSQ